MSPRHAILFLRVVAGGLILMGLCGLAGSLAVQRPVYILGFPVPTALIAATVLCVGGHYWSRVTNLQRKLAEEGVPTK